MRIAIIGATSQIARDLILNFFGNSEANLTLFSRAPANVNSWLQNNGLSGHYESLDYSKFNSSLKFDGVINFVGSGNPALTAALGASIFDITRQYDDLVVNYLKHHSTCKYIFLSSGAAYGSDFNTPVDENTKALAAINGLQKHDWYSAAKLCAELNHRLRPDLPIVDVRIFSYFSRSQDLSARFFVSEMLRAIQTNEPLVTSSANIVRDYIGPEDFYRLIIAILESPSTNDVIDCFTLAPVEKMELLSKMQSRFGLKFEVRDDESVGLNATGMKWNYFSKNFRARQFGFTPQNTSLLTVMKEAEILINKKVNL